MPQRHGRAGRVFDFDALYDDAMRIFASIAFIFCALVCIPRIGHAQVNACLGAHGERVYTDQPCAGAAPPGSGARSGDAVGNAGYPDATCPASPEALRARIADAFGSDDPNILSGLLLWRGIDHQTANARMRDFKSWLKRPLLGVSISGASAPPPPASSADPFGDKDPTFADALPGDAGAGDPQPGDPDYAPRHPNGLTVLTQIRGGNFDGNATPSARRFGMVARGGCWWLTF